MLIGILLILSLVSFVMAVVAVATVAGPRSDPPQKAPDEYPRQTETQPKDLYTEGNLSVRGPALLHNDQVVLSVPRLSQDISSTHNSAISLDTALTRIATAAHSTLPTAVRTLADGKVIGQVKTILYDQPGAPGFDAETEEVLDVHVNVQVAHGDNARAETIDFFRKGQCRTLVWMGDRWNLLNQTLSTLAYDALG